jgi:hypothetical protein
MDPNEHQQHEQHPGPADEFEGVVLDAIGFLLERAAENSPDHAAQASNYHALIFGRPMSSPGLPFNPSVPPKQTPALIADALNAKRDNPRAVNPPAAAPAAEAPVFPGISRRFLRSGGPMRPAQPAGAVQQQQPAPDPAAAGEQKPAPDPAAAGEQKPAPEKPHHRSR